MPLLPPRPVPGQPMPHDWCGKIWDYLISLRPKGVAPVIVQHKSGGCVYSMQKSPASSGGSAGSAAYTGPYAVVKKNDTTVTVILDADGTKYFQDSKIISGLTETDAGTNTDVTITVSGVVYADITYSAGWAVAFANAATKPAQTKDHIYIELAQVTFTDSKIGTIRQIQKGQIFPTQWGRVG